MPAEFIPVLKALFPRSPLGSEGPVLLYTGEARDCHNQYKCQNLPQQNCGLQNSVSAMYHIAHVPVCSGHVN